MTIAAFDDEVHQAKPPHPFWTLTEGRWMFEYGAFRLARQSLKNLPKGDGHPVLFLPGFLAGDASTKPMRSLFSDLGYEPHGWGLGQNLRFNEHREREMAHVLERIHQRAGRKVSIVGWSLGGVFARELAKMHPDKVRFVISLGSPISNDRGHSSARRLFEAINGKEPVPMQRGRYLALDEAPPVPTTSVLTKGDGIVHWRGSVQHAHRSKHDRVENIIVPASHVGLGLNPLVMVVIADRLAQKEDRWEKFDRSGWRSAFYQGV